MSRLSKERLKEIQESAKYEASRTGIAMIYDLLAEVTVLRADRDEWQAKASAPENNPPVVMGCPEQREMMSGESKTKVQEGSRDYWKNEYAHMSGLHEKRFNECNALYKEIEALQARIAKLERVADAARLVCERYWQFDKSMKAEVEALQKALAEDSSFERSEKQEGT